MWLTHLIPVLLATDHWRAILPGIRLAFLSPFRYTYLLYLLGTQVGISIVTTRLAIYIVLPQYIYTQIKHYHITYTCLFILFFILKLADVSQIICFRSTHQQNQQTNKPTAFQVCMQRMSHDTSENVLSNQSSFDCASLASQLDVQPRATTRGPINNCIAPAREISSLA